ncbi:AraC family transcriptional regulator [Primorskyibacter flagellatus]|uniref:AraC family transcriptional regulator n=2 Tax=Primorskyibacter flagellatus TaxID=1387277 RepID=A0A917EBH5_9RHOB|nr:AraC family transcriptional regulator [Primorskyibacter flagellatus]
MNVNMPTDSANPSRRVVFVQFDGAKLLDTAGPLQVFTDARTPEGRAAYDCALVSLSGGAMATDTGVALPTGRLDAAMAGVVDTLIVSGGRRAFDAMRDTALLAALAGARGRVRRLGSVCLGAFILAEGGVLDGARATTHWEACDRLAAEYPEITVERDAIYVADGPLWTSAGVSAGIDMALAMVEADLGRAEALRLARALVLYLRRPGGQDQFSAPLQAQVAAGDGRFDRMIAALRADPARDLSVAAMAAMAGMSERTFARQFRAVTGTAPARFVERLRVEAACVALAETSLPVKSVAARAGFGGEEQMRRAFRRQRGIAPSEYRARFAAGGGQARESGRGAEAQALC